ncbi:MAG TPA: TetR/AcrR family transcriptional regulator [Thermoleophilaceae bacterium]
MIQSAALLMRERGVDGTSFSEVLAHSGAPRGSIYHHFPGGKAQLVEEATAFGGEFIAGGWAAALQGDDPTAVVDAFLAFFVPVLEESDYTAGCPVVAGGLEGQRTPAARDAAGAAFKHWELLLAESLERRGVAEQRARSVATTSVAAMEGAIILARAQRSSGPLERVASELRVLIRASLSS